MPNELVPADQYNDQSALVVRAIREFAAHIPKSDEPIAIHPDERAREIVNRACIKTAGIAGTLAIPPGPAGMALIIPDLVAVWKTQQQMVSDVAACYGKTSTLNSQLMIYCLFRHGAAVVTRDIAIRVGERLLIKHASLKTMQNILAKLGISVSQKLIGKSISRWVPLVGPAVMSGYSYLDTKRVGKTAIESFQGPIEMIDANTDQLETKD